MINHSQEITQKGWEDTLFLPSGDTKFAGQHLQNSREVVQLEMDNQVLFPGKIKNEK